MTRAALHEELASEPAAETPGQAKGDKPTKTPAELWKEGLAAVKLTEEDALVAIDQMISQGYWSQVYDILQGRVTVELRTRDGDHSSRVAYQLSRLANPIAETVSQYTFRLNTAGSLLRFEAGKKKHTFEHAAPGAKPEDVDKLFDVRLKFFDALAQPIQHALFRKVQDFDNKVMAILADGAVEGF